MHAPSEIKQILRNIISSHYYTYCTSLVYSVILAFRTRSEAENALDLYGVDMDLSFFNKDNRGQEVTESMTPSNEVKVTLADKEVEVTMTSGSELEVTDAPIANSRNDPTVDGEKRIETGSDITYMHMCNFEMSGNVYDITLCIADTCI